MVEMSRDELREALVQEFQQARGGFAQALADFLTDALLAGPVGDLLAENERLRRWKSEAIPVMDGLQDLGRALGVGLGRQITARDSVDKALDLRNEVDRLTATLDAVRKYADEREANGRRGRTVHSIRIASDLRRILDATNGGDRDE